MNTHTLLLGIAFCLTAVNGRHYAERSDTEELTDERDEPVDGMRKTWEHSSNQMRHHRKRRQMNGYNYPTPYNPYYPEDRRYYDRNQQELLPHILRLLDDISAYVKRPPPPPPQPIYVPYPVPYPVPQYCNCLTNGTKQPNVGIRGGFDTTVTDPNRNWGFYEANENIGGDSDGMRDISFDPIQALKPTTRPAPKVDHGSNQATNDLQTQRPKFLSKMPASGSSRIPKVCDAAALSCCRPSDSRDQQKKCFIDLGCGSSYANGNACRPDAIASLIDVFSKTYAPVN